MKHGEGHVRVGPSKIGLGVFAGRRFKPLDMIGRIHGKRIDDPEHESDYFIELDQRHGLEPSAPFRYLNHSCQPNAALIKVEPEHEDDAPGETEIWVEALAQIEPGEELTIDYGWLADAAIPCRCGSPNCRGWIVAEGELQRVVPSHSGATG